VSSIYFLAFESTMSDVTQILSQIEHGNGQAAEKLLPLVYQELRNLAAAKMAQEHAGHTLQATALVHEAYVRLVDDARARHWDSRGHFFAAAAESMRRILLDHARRKRSSKKGGDRRRVPLPDVPLAEHAAAVDLIALDEALTALECEEPAKAQLIKLRYFAGLSVDEAAIAMGISRATAKRYWVYARAWLFGHMNGQS
jgi:RNA polymerase sigma factor (TIGR02999 family)